MTADNRRSQIKHMNQALQKLREFCGEERYVKFVSALKGPAKVSGHLFFWQEELLRDFSQSTGLKFPSDLNEILVMYCNEPIAIALANTVEPQPFLPTPVHRKFQSINQLASGGSHVTVFSVTLADNTDPGLCLFRDLAGPHDQPEIAQTLLNELSRGTMQFLAEQYTAGKPLNGLRIDLLEYLEHETDLKPHKYSAAIKFVLEDLLCEVKASRSIPQKLIGIPL